MKRHPDPVEPRPEQRSAAKKTALVLALLAFAIYTYFILTGVFGR